MNKNQFEKELKNNFTNIDNSMLEKFEIYKRFITQENDKYNLTRLDKDDLIYGKYFFNSVIPFSKINLSDKNILDIGSGSGIPGIALKILFPDMKLTIIESNNKKINFMKNLCTQLEFNDVEFYPIRAEEIPNELREKFDIVTSRAVSSLKVLLEISCQYVKIGGQIFEPKSISYKDELEESRDKIDSFGLSLKDIVLYNENEITNYTLIFDKIKASNNIYPRLWKDIIKE